MLGWHISVHRQTDGGASPARFDSGQGARVSVWQTGIGGLEWLDDLVKQGHAIDLGGNGYPLRYTARAEHLIPPITAGPPEARRTWVSGAQDVLTEKWAGRTVTDRAVADGCKADEWLLVEAWDES